MIKSLEIDLGKYFDPALLTCMFGLPTFKRLMDSFYTYSYDKKNAKSKKGFFINVEATDDFDTPDMLQTMLECMKTT